MNITEANQVNDLLRLLLAGPAQSASIDLAKAQQAAVALADRANHVLGAGLTGQQVALRWLDMSSRRAALLGFLDTFDHRDTIDDLAAAMTCREADAFVTVLSMHGRSGAASAFYAAHAASDSEGDAHHLGPVRHVGERVEITESWDTGRGE